MRFATVMLAAVSLAAQKDHIEVVKELVKLAEKKEVNSQQKDDSERNRSEWLSKVNSSIEKSKTLKSDFNRLTKKKSISDGQVALFNAEKSNWGVELT